MGNAGVAGMFVEVNGLATYVGGGALVCVTEAMVDVGESPKGALCEGVLANLQDTRRIVTSKMNPTRYLPLKFILASFRFNYTRENSQAGRTE